MPGQDPTDKEAPIKVELPGIEGGTAAVLTIRPGDTLVLMATEHLSVAEVDRLREVAAIAFPEVRCVVLEAGTTLGVVRRENGSYVDPGEDL